MLENGGVSMRANSNVHKRAKLTIIGTLLILSGMAVIVCLVF